MLIPRTLSGHVTQLQRIASQRAALVGFKHYFVFMHGICFSYKQRLQNTQNQGSNNLRALAASTLQFMPEQVRDKRSTMVEDQEVVDRAAADHRLLQLACKGQLLITVDDDFSTIERVHAALLAALRAAEDIVNRKPAIENAGRLARRIRSDLNFLERCMGQGASAPLDEDNGVNKRPDGECKAAVDEEITVSPEESTSGAMQTVNKKQKAVRAARVLTQERIQGLANNLRGYSGELLAAQVAPGLVAVNKKVHGIPCNATPAPGSSHEAQVATRRQTLAAQKRKQQEQDKQNGATRPMKAPEAACAEQPRSAEPESNEKQTARPDGSCQPSSTSECVQDQDAPSNEPQSFASCIDPRSKKQRSGPPGTDAAEPVVLSNQQQQQQGVMFMSAEVDVVCQGGSIWLEVKNQEPFGLDSEHWASNKGTMKGLRRQVQEMCAIAAAPCNAVRWQAPRVAVLFPSGADLLVVAALEDMGVTVLLDMDDLAAKLPSRPAEPTTTNLDTTAMCAVVSQVSHAQPGDPDIAAWGSKTPQWRQCVTEQEQEALMPQLERYLAPGRRLVAADVAVDQFEILISSFGGPLEKARWDTLRQRIEVIPTRQQDDSTDHNEQPMVLSERVLGLGSLREIGAQQLAVLGLGDALRAVTLTANGAAVRSADRQGVNLEVALHRAVWLTGL